MEPLPLAHRERSARRMRNKEQHVRGDNTGVRCYYCPLELDKEEAQRKAR